MAHVENNTALHQTWIKSGMKMDRVSSLTTAFVCSVLLLLPVVRAADLAYADLVDALSAETLTKAALKQVWEQHHGQEVTWSGTLVEAKGRKHFTRLYVLDRTRKDYKGYNIVAEVRDKDRAATLRKGDTVRFKGKLDKFNRKGNGSTVITVERSDIL